MHNKFGTLARNGLMNLSIGSAPNKECIYLTINYEKNINQLNIPDLKSSPEHRNSGAVRCFLRPSGMTEDNTHRCNELPNVIFERH